jgi:hypothetical protein
MNQGSSSRMDFWGSYIFVSLIFDEQVIMENSFYDSFLKAELLKKPSLLVSLEN